MCQYECLHQGYIDSAVVIFSPIVHSFECCALIICLFLTYTQNNTYKQKFMYIALLQLNCLKQREPHCFWFILCYRNCIHWKGAKFSRQRIIFHKTISPLTDHTLAENDNQCQALGMSTASWSTHGGQLHAQILGSIFCQVSSLQKGLFSLNRLASLKAVGNSALTPMH